MCKIKSIYTSIYFAIIIVPHIFRYVLLLLKNFLVINRIISLISYKSFIVVHTVLNFISSHPYFNGYCSYTRCIRRINIIRYRVSILILMDIALILLNHNLIKKKIVGFNPYFNGYCSYTRPYSTHCNYTYTTISKKLSL